ncbi:MAG: DUF1554 domain-containing protein [Polyangiales bacterium]
MMRYLISLFTFAALTNLASCAENPEGRFGCDSASDCPSGWFCRAGEASAQLRCYSSVGDGSDAGRADAGRADAGSTDAGSTDSVSADSVSADTGPDGASEDGDMPDVPLDATGDIGMTDAGSCGDLAETPECMSVPTLQIRSLRMTDLVGGGIPGMDAACAASFGAGYKALVLSSERFPGESDWVLASETCYAIESGEIAFRTDVDAVSESGVPSAPLAAGANFWTGANEDWTPSNENCDDWTSREGMGVTGFDVRECALKPFIGNHGAVNCSRGLGVLCVEQPE